MDGEAWWATVHGVAKSRTRLSDFTFTFYFHALEKEMATHSSVLAWRIPGTGEPGGLPSMGSYRIGHNWSDLAAAAARDLHGLTSSFCCCSLVCGSSYYPPVVISSMFCLSHTHKYHVASLWALLPLLKFWKVVRSVLRFCLLQERESHPLTTFWNLRFKKSILWFSSVQLFSRVQLWDPINCSMPGFPVHHQFTQLAQTHVHEEGNATQLSYPLWSPYPPTFNFSQHQDLFQWVSSLHQVAKVLEFQLQHQSFQCIFRTDFL